MILIGRGIILKQISLWLHGIQRATPENIPQGIGLFGFHTFQKLATASSNNLNLDTAALLKLLHQRVNKGNRMRTIYYQRIVIPLSFLFLLAATACQSRCHHNSSQGYSYPFFESFEIHLILLLFYIKFIHLPINMLQDFPDTIYRVTSLRPDTLKKITIAVIVVKVNIVERAAAVP